MLPSGTKNCAWLNMLNSSARNSSRARSARDVALRMPISKLLMPLPQQIERGALPIVPKRTVAFVKMLGSKPPAMGTQGHGAVGGVLGPALGAGHRAETPWHGTRL